MEQGFGVRGLRVQGCRVQGFRVQGFRARGGGGGVIADGMRRTARSGG